MKLRSAVGIALFYIFLPRTVHSQIASINVPDLRRVTIGGNVIYCLDPKDPAQGVMRWAGTGAVDIIHPLERVIRELQRPVPLFAIYGDASGQLYLCYADRPTGPKGHESPNIVIGKVDPTNSSITQAWSTSVIVPHRFAVGPSGHIYALGLAAELERKLLDANNSSSVSGEILHVIDPRQGITRSLLPVTIKAGRKGGILGLFASSGIAIRRNGNFLPFFDPVSAQGTFEDLLEAREYSSDGSLVRTYSYSDAPVGSKVASIQVDGDDSLLIQYMTVGKQPTNLPFVTHIVYGQSVVVRAPSDGSPPSQLSTGLPNNERLIGIRTTGELVTEHRGKKTMNIWRRD